MVDFTLNPLWVAPFILFFLAGCYYYWAWNIGTNPVKSNRPLLEQADEQADIPWSAYCDKLERFRYYCFDSDLDVSLLQNTLCLFFQLNPCNGCLELAVFWIFSKNPNVVRGARHLMLEALKDLPLGEKIYILTRVLFRLHYFYKENKVYTASNQNQLEYRFQDWFFTDEGLSNFIKMAIAVFKGDNLSLSIDLPQKYNSLIVKTISDNNLLVLEQIFENIA